jgi:Leucine Rich repeat
MNVVFLNVVVFFKISRSLRPSPGNILTQDFTRAVAMAALATADETPEWRVELDRVMREGEEELDLTRMALGDAEVSQIAETLRGGNAPVCELRLGFNAFGDSGALALAGLLRENNPSLKLLDLRYNDIDYAGMGALADALKHNSSVGKLHLQGNPNQGLGRSVGVDLLVGAINVNTTLEAVNVSGVPQVEAVGAALRDMEGRIRGRERFLSGPLTKAARTTE